MYVKDHDPTEMENRLGHPRVTEMRYEIHPWEYDVVDGSMADGRAHDVTMFIRQAEDPRQIALIRKPFFPPGAFRAPSGAAHRGETLEQGSCARPKRGDGPRRRADPLPGQDKRHLHVRRQGHRVDDPHIRGPPARRRARPHRHRRDSRGAVGDP